METEFGGCKYAIVMQSHEGSPLQPRMEDADRHVLEYVTLSAKSV
jgi:hypothetical protein